MNERWVFAGLFFLGLLWIKNRVRRLGAEQLKPRVFGIFFVFGGLVLGELWVTQHFLLSRTQVFILDLSLLGIAMGLAWLLLRQED